MLFAHVAANAALRHFAETEPQAPATLAGLAAADGALAVLVPPALRATLEQQPAHIRRALDELARWPWDNPEAGEPSPEAWVSVGRPPATC